MQETARTTRPFEFGQTTIGNGDCHTNMSITEYGDQGRPVDPVRSFDDLSTFEERTDERQPTPVSFEWPFLEPGTGKTEVSVRRASTETTTTTNTIALRTDERLGRRRIFQWRPCFFAMPMSRLKPTMTKRGNVDQLSDWKKFRRQYR